MWTAGQACSSHFLFVHVRGIPARQLDEKAGNLVAYRGDIRPPLLDRRRGRIAGTGVVRHLTPLSRRPRPTFAERGDLELARGAPASLAERAHMLGREVQHHARLELGGVVAEVGKKRLRIYDLEPVDHAQKDRDLRLQLPYHLAKIIRAMTVENNELRDALSCERQRDITEHQRLRAGVHVHAKRNVELPRVHAEWHERE